MCVLVVDDDLLVREIAVMVLEDAGHTTVEASNAAEALGLIREDSGHYTHLLTDVRMPGAMDGIDLAQIVRREQPSVTVIVTSGYNDRRAHRLDDAVSFLPKPWIAEHLLRLIQSTR